MSAIGLQPFSESHLLPFTGIFLNHLNLWPGPHGLNQDARRAVFPLPNFGLNVRVLYTSEEPDGTTHASYSRYVMMLSKLISAASSKENTITQTG